jgi:hypothetical protein
VYLHVKHIRSISFREEVFDHGCVVHICCGTQKMLLASSLIVFVLAVQLDALLLELFKCHVA